MDRQDKRFQLVLGVMVFLLWVVAVIAAYFVIHKPWWDRLSLEPFAALLDIVLACALVCLGGGLGRRILPPMGELHPLERVALDTALGLGILGLAWLVIGWVGLLTTWMAWLVLGAGLLLLRREVRDWMGSFRAVKLAGGELNRLGRFALGFTLLIFGLNLLHALAPPLKWDSLVYHLQVPAQYVAAGRVFFYPENIYAGFPQLAGMLYAWAIALHSVTTAATLGWAVGVVTFVGVEGFSRRILGEQVAWLAPAILLSGFSISQAMHWAYVDLWVMLYGLLLLVCLDHYRGTGRRVVLVLAGLMVGFAIGAKYTAGVLLFLGALVLIPFWGQAAGERDVQARLRFRFRRLVLDWIILGGIAVLAASPWLVKNQVLAGNPFYPLLFSGAELDPWRQTFQSGSRSTRGLVNDIFLPLDVTLFGIEGAIVEGKLEYGASIGPLMLALIPGLALGWKRFQGWQRRSLARLLVASLGAWLIWSIGAHYADELMRPRHYYGIFPSLAILAVAGFETASSVTIPQVRVHRVLGALVALALGLAAYAELIFFIDRNPLLVLAGRQAEMDYVSQELGGYGEAVQAVNDLPSGSAVLFLWEPRTLYCRGVTCYPDGMLANWWYLRRAHGDNAEIVRALCQKGITHLLVNDLGLAVFRDMSSNYEFDDWIAFERFRDVVPGAIAAIGGEYSLHELDCSLDPP